MGNLVGDKKKITGTVNTLITDLFQVVKISSPFPQSRKEPFKNMVAIHEGKRYGPDGKWGDMKVRNGSIVHVMRELTDEERNYLYKEDKQKRKETFEARCKSTQTDSTELVLMNNVSNNSVIDPRVEIAIREFSSMRAEVKALCCIFAVYFLSQCFKLLPF